MRTKVIKYVPLTTNATGYASNVTGGTWTLTSTSSGTGLAYKVRITNDSATNHSAKTAVIVGTDAEGRPQTETMNLPNSSTTSDSAKFYKTVTSVTPSATIGVDTMDIGWVVVGNGPAIPLDYRFEGGNNIGIQVAITGTINYDIEYTYDPVQLAGDTGLLLVPPVNPTWNNHATIAAKTTSSDGTITGPVRAIRLAVNTVTNGATVILTINQG